MIIVNFKKTRDDAILPERKTSGSAGYDLYALLDGESILLLPGEKYKFRTGASMELPSGYCAFVSSRSSVSWNQDLEIIGGNGTIDDDYRGEIMVPLRNVGRDAQRVYNGQRIAQLVIQKYEAVKFNEVKDLNKTERGDGSFGSTGR